jgi:hypothetical protein
MVLVVAMPKWFSIQVLIPLQSLAGEAVVVAVAVVVATAVAEVAAVVGLG